MKKDKNDRLQAYTDNEMTAAEKAAFAAELQADADLQNDRRLLRDMNRILGDAELVAFRKQATDLVDKETESHRAATPQTGKIMWLQRLTAAAAALILCLSLYFLLQPAPVDYTAVVQEYFVEYPRPTSRGPADRRSLIFDLYSNKNYAEAAPALEKFGNENKDSEALFFAGTAYLAANDAAAALAVLQDLDPPPTALAPQVFYYRGLAYLQRNDRENAVLQLEKVTESNPFLYRKAGELLQRLRK